MTEQHFELYDQFTTVNAVDQEFYKRFDVKRGLRNNDGTGGMAYCENLARMWLEDNPDGYLTYIATPAYEGDELVCRSVIVDMLSSDGEMNVRIEVFNAAKGYEVNYADGTFTASGA